MDDASTPRWTFRRQPDGRMRWDSDPAFIAWMRDHSATLTNRELAAAISLSLAEPLAAYRAKELRRRFGLPVDVPTTKRAYDERLHCDKVPVFIQRLGPADTEHFVTVEGNAAITSDWHIPHQDDDMVERLIAVCKRAGVDQLVINGDFLNEDAFSRWPHHRFQIPWPAEKAVATAVLERLLKAFRRVVWTLDNHDRRILAAQERQFQGRGLDESDIVGMVTRGIESGNLRASTDYHYILVKSGGQVWRVTSPKEYRRNKLSLANRLAQLYHQNVIVGGDHLSGVGTDDSGRYAIASNLSMINRSSTPYVMVADTSFPHWQKGFHLIVDGVLHTFCDHPGLVNWDYWTTSAAPLVQPSEGLQARPAQSGSSSTRPSSRPRTPRRAGRARVSR